ncbi:TetR/AcrR family transcriptional regulator [Actinomadura yumaensis]|uniref:TetR/AcrR family transcriptional regulator n=1 Tax=Actinomadura yumaensis TaxID=111807 RepID=A0ABW2CPH9_9ACTN
MVNTGGRPARLNLDRILDEAREIVAADGVEKLSMRRLAARLDSTPTALYHYVRDKDELLAELIASADLHIDAAALPEGGTERLVALCERMHRLFVAHRWAIPVLATGVAVNARGAWLTNEILTALTERGLTPSEAFLAHETLWYFTAGHALLAHRHRRHDAAAPPHYTSAPQARGLAMIEELAPVSGDLARDYSFTTGLRHLLDGTLPRERGA